MTPFWYRQIVARRMVTPDEKRLDRFVVVPSPEVITHEPEAPDKGQAQPGDLITLDRNTAGALCCELYGRCACGHLIGEWIPPMIEDLLSRQYRSIGEIHNRGEELRRMFRAGEKP